MQSYTIQFITNGFLLVNADGTTATYHATRNSLLVELKRLLADVEPRNE